jgi:TRAP-type C4-dicarboxylate transport system substrate-binding protein
MHVLRSLSVALALSPAIALAPAAGAQDKAIHLKLAHWVPPAHPLQKAMEDWGKSVQQATNGTVTFTVFPSQQLGKAFDHYDMARDGIADVTYINPGYQPGRFPIIDAANLPFLMSNGKGGSQALDAWYRKYAPTEMKDVKFCLGFVHDYGSFHSRAKKIVAPGDIKGMKIRPAHATMAALVTQLGGTNVQSSAPEVRDIIEKGVADAVTFPWGSVPLFGIDKVTKYHMNVPLYVTSFAWVMNQRVYDSMSPTQRKAIDDHCTTDWALRVAAPWADYERAGVTKLQADKASGREVYTLSEAQVAEWRKAAEPVVEGWAKGARKAGVDPDAVLAELKASLTKYNALQ